jgi:hypothetical protein
MSEISRAQFLRTFPEVVLPQLPEHLQGITARQPYHWLVQFHFGEPRLHYELSPVRRRQAWELGLHFEARDKALNRYLLLGMRRHLFEIKSALGDNIEAEMWDRGWTKVYEVIPAEPLTTAFQASLGARAAAVITCLHPIFVSLRRDVASVHR